MQYIITIIIIALPFFVKKSKYIRYLQLLWIWVLIGGCSYNLDMPGYKSLYDTIDVNYIFASTECIFEMFCIVIRGLGLSYQNLVEIWALIFLIVMDRGICKLTDRPEIVYSFMCIYPLIDTIVQLKNFAGCAVIIYGIHFLQKRDRSDIVKYVICVLVASMLHTAFAFYILLIIVPFLQGNARMQMLYMMILPFFVVIVPFFIDRVGRIVTTDAVVDLYLKNSTKVTTIFILLCWQIAGVVLHSYCVTGRITGIFYGEPELITGRMNRKEQVVIRTILIVNICVLLIGVFYFVDAIFQRLVRTILILDGVSFSILWKYRFYNTQIKKYMVLWGGYLLFSAVIFYVITGDGAWASNRLALENNIFW